MLCLRPYFSNVVPQRRQVRNFVPSGMSLWPTRACLLQEAQKSNTFEMFSGPSFSTIPPLTFFEGFARV
jgi:hypothetical protein